MKQKLFFLTAALLMCCSLECLASSYKASLTVNGPLPDGSGVVYAGKENPTETSTYSAGTSYTQESNQPNTLCTFVVSAKETPNKYQFDHWEAGNNVISIEDPTSPTTKVSVRTGDNVSKTRYALITPQFRSARKTVTLNSDGYATYSSDIDLLLIDSINAYKAAVTDNTIMLTRLRSSYRIPAGTGMLLLGPAGATATFRYVEYYYEAEDFTGNDLKPTTLADGTLAPMEENSWALKGDEFLQYTPDTYVPNKAYIVHEAASGARSMNIVFADSETTGVSELRGESLEMRDGKRIENGRLIISKNGRKYNAAGQQIR